MINKNETLNSNAEQILNKSETTKTKHTVKECNHANQLAKEPRNLFLLKD
jgi:hypothetical protein